MNSNHCPITSEKLFILVITLLLSFTLTHLSYAGRYFLCGPDENGCNRKNYEYCSCIPLNSAQEDKPYCLNFNSLSCTPLSETPECDPFFIYHNQGECLATIFHSMPTHPCTLTTEAFCLKHNSYFCAADGKPSTCHKS